MKRFLLKVVSNTLHLRILYPVNQQDVILTLRTLHWWEIRDGPIQHSPFVELFEKKYGSIYYCFQYGAFRTDL